MLVLGIQKREGEYNGNKYSNYYFHMLLEEQKNSIGQIVTIEKVKCSLVDDVCSKSKIALQNLIGMDVNFNYDKFGRVQSLELYDRAK